MLATTGAPIVRASACALVPSRSGQETWTWVGAKSRTSSRTDAGKADRDPIFASPRNADRGHRDEIAGGREGRILHRRRIDAHRRAAAQQMADEAIERAVGAVADAIVIAREQGDAQPFGRIGRRLAFLPPSECGGGHRRFRSARATEPPMTGAVAAEPDYGCARQGRGSRCGKCCAGSATSWPRSSFCCCCSRPGSGSLRRGC